MNENFEQIDIVFVQGKNEGNGHFLRMNLLANSIKKKHPKAQVALHNFENKKKLNGAEILVCDIRDYTLTEEVLNLYKLVIFLDNRNKNRNSNKNYVYADTLPHYNMTIHEYKNSLRYFLADEYFFSGVLSRKKSGKIFVEKNFSSVVKYRRQGNNRRLGKQNMLQLPLSFVGYTLRLPKKKFLQKLETKQNFVGYFGQSMLEALLLQKNVFLYPVSKYHAKLSHSFARRWNASKMNLLYLDNKGIERLLVFIEAEFKKI